MADTQNPDYRKLRNALRRSLEQPALAQKLKSEETAAQAMKELRIESDNGARTEIINILNDIERCLRPTESKDVSTNLPTEKAESRQEIISAKTFFEDAFNQLRRAYFTSMIMSVTMFILGVGLLSLAAVQAILRPQDVVTASVIGGIGIVQIVALFYRNPLADIARSVSNAQRAKIAITSYLIGISLIRDSIGIDSPKENHIQSLLQVTDKALGQLQTHANEHKSNRSDAKE